MAQSVASKTADPSFIEQIDIFSNSDSSKSVSIVNGIASLSYTESIMSDTIKMTVSFIDTGNSINNKTVLEGLPLVGQERVVIKFSDNNENTIGGSPQLVMYVNKVTPISDKIQTSIINLELVSKEYIFNEKVRVNKRYDGKISDHVNDILKNKLKTTKKINVEECINNFNYLSVYVVADKSSRSYF